MNMTNTIANLEPGEDLRTALETEVLCRLHFHPQVVEAPLLYSQEVGHSEVFSPSAKHTFHDSAEGLVLMIETTLAIITLYPNDTLVRQHKCGSAN